MTKGIISGQSHTILELNDKLSLVSQEAESMKSDIQTLVSRLSEAESSVDAIAAYQQECEKAQKLLDNSKKEVHSLKGKLSALTKDRTEKESKIKELEDSIVRTKRVLSVTRQGRARSEQNLKASNEEVTSLKELIEKKEAQINVLKNEKVEAQNAKVREARKARLSVAKLKDLTDECNRASNVDELEQRVIVLAL